MENVTFLKASLQHLDQFKLLKLDYPTQSYELLKWAHRVPNKTRSSFMLEKTDRIFLFLLRASFSFYVPYAISSFSASLISCRVSMPDRVSDLRPCFFPFLPNSTVEREGKAEQRRGEQNSVGKKRAKIKAFCLTIIFNHFYRFFKSSSYFSFEYADRK